MRDKVTIAYRGARYAIGLGRNCYGIWPAAAPQGPPAEWWPETSGGWREAWVRFASIEAPGTIEPVSRRRTGPSSSWRPAGPPGPGGAAAASVALASAEPPGVSLASAELASAEPASAGSASAGSASAGRSGAGTAAAVLLAAGVASGIGGLFPGYTGGASLASQPALLVQHVSYLAAWALSALLIVPGGRRLRAGALLGLGITAVTFGFFFADAGTVIAGGAHLIGAGLLLSLAGWGTCAAGSVLAVWAGLGRRARQRDDSRAGRLELGGLEPGGTEPGQLAVLALAATGAIGAAIAFVPSWDSYTLRTLAGASQVITEGNAFANPAPVIAGNVAVMVALVVVAVLAALCRPARLGAALLAGAIVPLAAQAVSAPVLLSAPVSPAQFGISPGQAAQAGLTISTGLTAAFWAYCAFVVVLAVTCGWLLLTRRTPGRDGARRDAAARDAAPDSSPVGTLLS